MMMSVDLSVAAHNMAGALGDPGRKHAWEHVKGTLLDGFTDAVVLSEVLRHHGPEKAEILGRLGEIAAEQGYELIPVPYNDETPRRNQDGDFMQHLALLYKSGLDVAWGGWLPLATRNAAGIKFERQGMKVRLAGAHFDDRSFEARQGQFGAYLASLSLDNLLNNEEEAIPNLDILAGDLNSLPLGLRSLIIANGNPIMERAARLFNVPPEGPEIGPDSGWRDKLERLISIGYRATHMALSGWDVARLYEEGFKNANTSNVPTHMLGQIDHVLYRAPNGDVSAELGVGEKCDFSDHRLIKANFFFES